MQPSKFTKFLHHFLHGLGSNNAGSELIAILEVNDIVAGIVAEDEDELPHQIILGEFLVNQSSVSGHFDVIKGLGSSGLANSASQVCVVVGGCEYALLRDVEVSGSGLAEYIDGCFMVKVLSCR